MGNINLLAYDLNDKRDRIALEARNLCERIAEYRRTLDSIQDIPAEDGKPENKARTKVDMALLIDGAGIEAHEKFVVKAERLARKIVEELSLEA
jgi:hypothetical protein